LSIDGLPAAAGHRLPPLRRLHHRDGAPAGHRPGRSAAAGGRDRRVRRLPRLSAAALRRHFEPRRALGRAVRPPRGGAGAAAVSGCLRRARPKDAKITSAAAWRVSERSDGRNGFGGHRGPPKRRTFAEAARNRGARLSGSGLLGGLLAATALGDLLLGGLLLGPALGGLLLGSALGGALLGNLGRLLG